MLFEKKKIKYKKAHININIKSDLIYLSGSLLMRELFENIFSARTVRAQDPPNSKYLRISSRLEQLGHKTLQTLNI